MSADNDQYISLEDKRVVFRFFKYGDVLPSIEIAFDHHYELLSNNTPSPTITDKILLYENPLVVFSFIFHFDNHCLLFISGVFTCAMSFLTGIPQSRDEPLLTTTHHKSTKIE